MLGEQRGALAEPTQRLEPSSTHGATVGGWKGRFLSLPSLERHCEAEYGGLLETRTSGFSAHPRLRQDNDT